MALYLKKADACFLHIPKTGGHWVESALRRAKITAEPMETVACVHNRHALRGHVVKRCRYYFCFVRHPGAWYASVWSHYQQAENQTFDLRQWNPLNSIADLMGLQFAEFVGAVCDRFPDGFLTWLYQAYAGKKRGKNHERVHFVGRTENLIADLNCILKRLGYRPNRLAIASVPPANVSRKRPALTPPLWDRIAQAERRIVRDYNYTEPPDAAT